MKRDTLIQMARQAGLEFVNQWHPLIEKFEKFALLVAEHEREECAVVSDTRQKIEGGRWASFTAMKITEAIRARGGK